MSYMHALMLRFCICLQQRSPYCLHSEGITSLPKQFVTLTIPIRKRPVHNAKSQKLICFYSTRRRGDLTRDVQSQHLLRRNLGRLSWAVVKHRSVVLL